MEEIKILKVEEQPYYITTGRIVDEKNRYVAGTKTKELAEELVLWRGLLRDLIDKFAND